MTDNELDDQSIEEETTELRITRTVDTPRERLWKAWTDPEQVAKWWGPNGFTNTVHEMNVRPAGVWRFVMHGPDGADYYNEFVYDEIVEPERLVYTHPQTKRTASCGFR
ncbi:SRPBCC domain-containing protein [Haladaptatus pallidirubidus]|uniref:SRPBCC domain-containing protein n=1 Tax=Haladaptatus pallidirubidus TaxID=1008152 RepID=UPI0035EBC5B4